MKLGYQQHSYRVVAQKEINLDIGEYLSYGIQIICGSTSQECVKIIEDISDRQEFVLHLVHACNSCELDPIHFMDVVEDAILMKEKEISTFIRML